MMKKLKALWATFRRTPEPDSLMRWLRDQREVKLESFPAFNGELVHVVTIGNVTASSPHFDTAVREVRKQLCLQRKPDGVRVTLSDGRILA